MTRPPNPESLEMTRRAPNDVKATHPVARRAIGRNTRDATPYADDERTLEDDESKKVGEDVVAHSKELDGRLAEALQAADDAQAAGKNPKAQLNPEPDRDKPDTIDRGRRAAPPATRRDAGQSRTGERE